MLEEFLSRVFFNQTAVFVIISVLLLVTSEIGFRFGRSALRRNPDKPDSNSGSAQGAALGLLGLLLGFSFAMAVGRNDTRRSLAIDEANSIGTTFLRADFLPEDAANQTKDLLRAYTKIRLDAAVLHGDGGTFMKLVDQSEEIQAQLWDIAVTASAASPTPLTVSYINSLNETIDLQTKRLAGRRNHVPGAVWLLLLIVSACGTCASSFSSGTGGSRAIFSQFIFPILIATVITLISDMDRPRKGLIGVSQEPLGELYESISP